MGLRNEITWSFSLSITTSLPDIGVNVSKFQAINIDNPPVIQRPPRDSIQIYKN